MRQSTPSIFTTTGQPKYLGLKERKALERAVLKLPIHEQLFCQTLIWTGCRISEVLSLTASNFVPEQEFVVVRTLKKRDRVEMRCIPLPCDIQEAILEHCSGHDGRLFPWGRTRGWTIIKRVMVEAGIANVRATPRALRHTFAVRALQDNVPITTVKDWLGHSSLKSTAIYSHIVGAEQISLAARTWRERTQIY